MQIDAKALEKLERNKLIFSTPLDVDKYIADGLISRYQNRKTQFVLNCSMDDLPEDIRVRINEVKALKKKGSPDICVLGLNLKVAKF